MDRNRYVAFLDILGFADLVNEHSLEHVLPRVQQALGTFQEVCRGFPAITIATKGKPASPVKPPRQFSFSDTFIVVSEDDSIQSLSAVAITAALWTRLLFGQALPVRGVITYGEADYIPGTDHLIGKAIVRAHDLERIQEWLGVVVDEHAIPSEFRIVFQHPCLTPLFVRWNVPLKDGKVLVDALAVNWRVHLKVQYGVQSLFRPPRNSSQKAKIDASLSFAKHIRSSGLDTHVIKGDDGKIVRPWYLEPLFVGVGDPATTEHGDEY